MLLSSYLLEQLPYMVPNFITPKSLSEFKFLFGSGHLVSFHSSSPLITSYVCCTFPKQNTLQLLKEGNLVAFRTYPLITKYNHLFHHYDVPN